MSLIKNPLIAAGAIGFGVVTVGVAGAAAYVCRHPQLIVGRIQAKLYKDGSSPNSWEPVVPTVAACKPSGVYYTSNHRYGEDYPNSYLDITYPSEDTSVPRPTIIYLHGGGFFGGSKASGDPLAKGNEMTFTLDQLVQRGYNLVNVDYALVPQHRFPVPVLQMNQAINWCVEHAQELGLDMSRVVIMGSSAGAILTAQYAAILSNPAYEARYDFVEPPRLPLDALRCVVIDDAPLDYDDLHGLGIKVLSANYLGTSVLMRDHELNRWASPLPWMNGAFPPAFMTAGTDDGFPQEMAEAARRLQALGVDAEYFHTDEETYGKTRHGYLAALAQGRPEAIACFERLVAFLSRHCPATGMA